MTQKVGKISFTGERMIPDINKGATLYYEHILRYLFSAGFTKGKSVLDLGCGAGYGSYIFSLLGAKEVLGIDISKEAIKNVKKKYKRKNLDFQTRDVLDLSFLNKKIDVAVSFELIEHLENQKKHLLEVKKVLKKNGIFIVSTPNKLAYPSGNPFHKKELLPKEFLSLLRQYFKYVSISYQYFWLANLLIPEHFLNKKIDLRFDKILKTKTDLFLPSFKPENSQYLVAVCSDFKTKNMEASILSTPKVDRVNLKHGTLILDELVNERDKKQELERVLNEITSAKTFKVWQAFVKLRTSFFEALGLKNE